jgi:hypothetical protein
VHFPDNPVVPIDDSSFEESSDDSIIDKVEKWKLER